MKQNNIILWLCVFMLFAKYTSSQNSNLDSLVSQLNYQHNDTNKVFCLNRIVLGYYHQSKFDTSLIYAKKSLALSDKLDFLKGQQISNFQQGYIYYRKSFFESAIYHGDQSLKICRIRKDKKGEAEVLNLLGIIYKNKGNYYKSLELYFEALQIWEDLKNRSKQIVILNNIGLANHFLEKYEIAYKYYQASFKICKETNNTNGKSLFYNNCGLLFHKQKLYKKALSYYKKSLEIELQQNDSYGIPICYLNIGNVYNDRKKYNEALKYYNKSYQICNKYSDIFGVANVYIAIAKTYSLQGNYQKSIEFLLKSLDKATTIRSTNFIKDAYKELSECYAKQGDYCNAYRNYKLYKETNDSIFSTENNKHILELHTKYETEKKEIENRLLKEEQKKNEEIIAREEAEINNQHLIIFIITNILLFVSIITYFLHCVNKKKKALNKKLTQQNIEINEQKEKIKIQRNQLKRSAVLLKQQNIKLRASNNTKDKFFSIISHDLRSPFNSLLGLSNILLTKHREFDNEKREELIKKVNKSANRAFQLLEDLLIWAHYQLAAIKYNPSEIDLEEVLNRVISLIEEQARDKNIHITKRLNNSVIYADKDMISTLFRNLISNAIKFTNRGGNITISSKTNQSNNYLEISVKDNGIGIPEERIEDLFCIDRVDSTDGTEDETGTGLGLILCKELINKHKGEIWVESKVGIGSEFKFTIPNKVEVETSEKSLSINQ